VSRNRRYCWYLGYTAGRYHLFFSEEKPTRETNGHVYDYVWGPFREKGSASWAAEHGRGNPHVRTPHDADVLFRLERFRGRQQHEYV